MFGGKILRDIQHRPTGGFPPIFLCDKETEKSSEQKDIKREYSVSSEESKSPLLLMKDILTKRRTQQPSSKEFVSL